MDFSFVVLSVLLYKICTTFAFIFNLIDKIHMGE
jgi:hypothetical protein